MSEPIIIETPAPPTRERLVLVPVDVCNEVREDDPRVKLGAKVGLTVFACHARDATADDLGRAGWVTGEMLAEQVRIVWAAGQKAEEAARANRAEGLLIQRETELRLAREDGAAVERQMREARSAADASFVRANQADMRAEKAERERDEVSVRQGRCLIAQAVPCVTCHGHGRIYQPDDALNDDDGATCRACGGTGHERTDAEWLDQAMTVGLAQCDALRRTVAKLTERCEQWEGERNAIAFVLSTTAERRGDYGSLGYATLARLLGEVARG